MEFDQKKEETGRTQTSAPYSNLEQAYRWYKQCHSNPVNAGIHVVCIPILVFTLALMLATQYQWVDASELLGGFGVFAGLKGIRLFYGGISGWWLVVWSMYYLYLKPWFGLVMIGWLYPLFCAAVLTRHEWYPTGTWLLPAVFFHILAWTLQVIGHLAFEHKNPAFLESVVQAFLSAPMFVTIDVLHCVGITVVPKEGRSSQQQDKDKLKLY
jgi:uncharacterized membrane protein YGL010W